MTSLNRLCSYIGIFAAIFITSTIAVAGPESDVTNLQSMRREAVCADAPEYDLPSNAPFSPDYCAVRKRFFEKFFFDGSIAEGVANPGSARPHVKFADQTAYMGFALVTFAGEARILDEHGLDTRSSELVIARILEEFDKLDNEAEAEAFQTNKPGFFVRDYVKRGVRPDMTKIGRHSVESDWGAANPRNKEMSKDQVVHLLVGMWAVSQWAPDHHFDNRAQARYHTQRIINYLKSERFYITMPNSETVVARGGGVALADAGFLLNIAGATLGKDVSGGAKIRYPFGRGFSKNYHAETAGICTEWKLVWKGLKSRLECIKQRTIVWWDFDVKWAGGWIAIPASWTHSQVVDQVNSHRSLKNIEIRLTPDVCPFPIIFPFKYISGMPGLPDLRSDCLNGVAYTVKYKPSSFEYNLALLEFAFEADIQSSTFDQIAAECTPPQHGNVGHVWAKLLRSLYRNQPADVNVIMAAASWHAKMPEDGPKGDWEDNLVWNKDNRWIRCGDTYSSSDSNWIYNGLDFLSLENLTRLHDPTALETGIPMLRNQAPVLDPMLAITINESQQLTEPISASDPDNDELYFEIDGPSFVRLNDNGNGTGALDLTPTFEDSGEYVVTLSVTDPSGEETQQKISITVLNVNRPPKLGRVEPVSIEENRELAITLSAFDEDEPYNPELAWRISPNPNFVVLDHNGGEQAKLILRPDFEISTAEADQRFSIDITVSDGEDHTTQTVEITVVNVNRPPILRPIEPTPIVIVEGQHLTKVVEVSDPDGQPITLSGSGLQSFATLQNRTDGTFELALDPSFRAAGSFEVVLTATDPEGATATQEFSVDILNALRPLDTGYQFLPYKGETGIIDLVIGNWRPNIASQIEVLTADGWVDVVNDDANKAWNHDALQGDEVIRFTYGRNALMGDYRWVIHDKSEKHGEGWLVTTSFVISEVGKHLAMFIDLPRE